MALSRRRIEELAAKLVDGTINPTEQEQLNRWLDGRMRRDTRTLESDFASDAESLRQRMLARILEQAEVASPRRGPRIWRWTRWPVAAAVMLAISTVIWLSADKTAPESSIELVADDIMPGGNRATLTFADGQTIDLDETQSGIVVGNQISYLDGSAVLGARGTGSLYDAGGVEAREPANAKTHMLSLTTPKGGTYRITLPDGSNIWLNAGTTLTYPSRFAENERVVTLEGEAFFEIKAQRLAPFKVMSNGQRVEVLGTRFNVSAYAGDIEATTTLVDGSVKVMSNAEQGTTATSLSPGQQATIRNAEISVRDVEVEQYTAWKDGFFYFDGLSPAVAFVQLSRWYDLDILYKGASPSVKFFGMIERDKPLGSILRILEKSGINFEITQEAGRNQLHVINE